MKKLEDLLLECIKTRNLGGMQRVLKANPNAVNARLVGAAGGSAWKEGLALLKEHGADLNVLPRVEP